MDQIHIARELRVAVQQGDTTKFLALVGDDASLLNMNTVFGSWLHLAASHGQLEIVQRLVELGLDVNARGGFMNGTALDRAASKSHLEVVRYLLSRGAEMDVSELESNPLFSAIHGGHTAVAKLLLDSGIDIHATYIGKNQQNRDALSFAREWGRTDIVDLLTAAGKSS